MATKDRLKMQRFAKDGLRALESVERVIASGNLDSKLTHLVKLRVSQINGCVYCVGLHHKEAIEDGEAQNRLDHLVVWQETGLYSPAECAALAWSEALTTLGINVDLDCAHQELSKYLSSEDIGTLMLVVVMINTWNRILKASHGQFF